MIFLIIWTPSHQINVHIIITYCFLHVIQTIAANHSPYHHSISFNMYLLLFYCPLKTNTHIIDKYARFSRTNIWIYPQNHHIKPSPTSSRRYRKTIPLFWYVVQWHTWLYVYTHTELTYQKCRWKNCNSDIHIWLFLQSFFPKYTHNKPRLWNIFHFL